VQTPNLHLNLFTPLGVGWREDATAGLLLDENMALLDKALSTGVGVDANEIGGIAVNGNEPSHPGMLLISQPGNESAIWADPQVQGLYAAGASISSPPAYVAPDTIQPILIGASDPAGKLQSLTEDASGNLLVKDSLSEGYLDTLAGTVSLGKVTVAGTVSATQGTSPWVVSNGGTFAVQDSTAEGYLDTLATCVSGDKIAISAASLPLPVNAAQETGGNLATLAGTVSSGRIAVSGQPDQVIASNSSTTTLESLIVTGASYNASTAALTLTGAWSSIPGRVGQYYYVDGFTGAATGNNSTITGFICTAQGANTITLTDATGYSGFTGQPVAAQMFVGAAVDCTASLVASISVSVISDQASLANGMMLEWSDDGVNWDHIQSVAAVGGRSNLISDKTRARYFRAVYINGAFSQGYFRLQTITSAVNTSGTVRDLQSSVYATDEAELVRSVVTGQQTITGQFVNILTDILGNLNVGFGGIASDAFGRGRMSNPTCLFNAQFQYDNQPLLFQQPIFGTGTCAKTAGETSMTLATGGTGLGASAQCQTKEYFRYQPGKSQQIFMTGMLGGQKANVRSEIGYNDDNDGLLYRMDGSLGACIVQRSSVPGVVVGAIPAIALVHGTGTDGLRSG